LKNVFVILTIYNAYKQFLKKLNDKLSTTLCWKYPEAWKWNKTIIETCSWDIIVVHKILFLKLWQHKKYNFHQQKWSKNILICVILGLKSIIFEDI
jgi:hypothetical protein